MSEETLEKAAREVAIPFVIGAIFGPMCITRGTWHSIRRNPLCDRGYLRTHAHEKLKCGGRESRNPLCDRGYLRTAGRREGTRLHFQVAIPFVIGAIFGLKRISWDERGGV